MAQVVSAKVKDLTDFNIGYANHLGESQYIYTWPKRSCSIIPNSLIRMLKQDLSIKKTKSIITLFGL